MSPPTGPDDTGPAHSVPDGRTAVVLAGGHSTRFGDADKAVAELAGTPMIRRVFDRLDPVIDEFVVNCRDEQVPAIHDALAATVNGDDDGGGSDSDGDGGSGSGNDSDDGTATDTPTNFDVCFAVDPVPDRGPMAGIMAGLRAAQTEFAAVVACDMPFVDPELVSYLFDRTAATDADAAVPRLEDEWFQTTQAVYRTEPMADACERAVDRGDRRIVEPLFELDYVVVDTDEVREYADLETFENINTPDEFEDAAERLGGPS